MLDIREILRRVRLGESDRAIADQLAAGRRTVKKYREWARQAGLLQGELPATEALNALLQTATPEARPPKGTSSVEAHRELVVRWREQGLEAQAVWQRLTNDHQFTGSYAAVWRFIRHLEPQTPEATVRVEVKPGEEAQVDFGYVGLMLDPATGQMRKTWAFVMTVSWSRHQYVEFVFDQTVATWLKLHQHAFAYLGGVPQRVVLDNLKAAIVKACFEDPTVQRSYRDLAEHYGFLIAPCRPRTPEHKGKVESGVHYVQRNLLVIKDYRDITDANQGALDWIEHWAGQRIHGTTKRQPLPCFNEVERALLLPLPTEAYDLAVWKRPKVGRDCYVTFDNAYYSAPERLIGQEVWVRGGLKTVSVSADYELVALHPRAQQPGERHTTLSHLPAEKVAGLVTTRESCAAQALEIGPSTGEVIQRLLAERPVDRLPMAKRVLRLAETYGSLRLERACTRALQFDDYRGQTIRTILEKALDLAALPPFASAILAAPRFARTAEELLPGLGGVSWN